MSSDESAQPQPVSDEAVKVSELAAEQPEEAPKKTRRPNRGSSKKGRAKKSSEEKIETPVQ